MRLIDADNLPVVNSIERIDGKDVFVASWIPGSSIENAPTVDAIPWEFLVKWFGDNYHALTDLQIAWEKENGKN